MGKNTAYTIFDLFAADLFKTLSKHNHLVEIPEITSYQDLYFCPLSLCFYQKDHIGTGQLTIEHVPPQSLGGKPLVLTSREINNNDGRTVDKELLDYFRFRNYCLGRGTYPVSISSEDLNIIGINAEISYSKEKNKFSVISHRKNIEALNHKGFFTKWDGTKTHFTCEFPSKLNKKSLLKVAYLTAFRYLKYDLIFNKKGFKYQTYGAIVDSLKCEDSVQEFPVLYTAGHALFEDLIVGIINDPIELRAIFVNLTFSLEGSDYKCTVFLPHSDDTSLENYLRLESRLSDVNNPKQMLVKGIPFRV